MPLDREFLEELQAADAQGERALMSLWPGDQFYMFGKFWTIQKMQWDVNRRDIWVTTTEPQGEPYELHFEGSEPYMHQPRVRYKLDGLMTFPSLLSDEHAAEEYGPTSEVW